VVLTACGRREKPADAAAQGRLSPAEVETAKAYKHPLAEAYYKEHPEFFHFASPADLPAGLKWEDGADQPELGSPEAKKGGEITFWLPDFPRTLRFNGPDSNGAFRAFIHDDNGMTVVKKHPVTGKYYPGLATAWSISADRRTVYLKLDPRARYSDGVPVTADDYFFLMYFCQSPWLQEPWAFNWYHEKYTGITKYDDYTIAIGLTDAKPDVLRFFEEDVRPIPRYFYRNFGEDYVSRYQWVMEPTTGPYISLPGDIEKGRSITLRRVEDWWAKDNKFYRYRFNPDRERFIVIRDVAKAVEAFKAGEFDILPVTTPDMWYEKLPKSDPVVAGGYVCKVQFYNEIPRPTYGLSINRSQPFLKDREVRIGINYAMNWQAVLENYFRGDYTRMRTTADGYGEFTHPTLTAREFSVEKALEHFGKAGFTKRGPDGILVNKDGARLSFTLTTGYRPLAEVLTILEREARKAGLELKLEVLDMTAAWKKSQEKKHEIVLAALNVSIELYPRYFDIFHSYNAYKPDGSIKPDTNNLTMTADPQLDALIDRYEKSVDLGEIKSLARQIEEWLHDDAAFIPGFVRPFYWVAYWRWVRWPEGFDYRLSRDPYESHCYWIDSALKQEVLDARRAGKTFPAEVKSYDQYKVR
jgi:microcin C transport system substrate-binding protein